MTKFLNKYTVVEEVTIDDEDFLNEVVDLTDAETDSPEFLQIKSNFRDAIQRASIEKSIREAVDNIFKEPMETEEIDNIEDIDGEDIDIEDVFNEMEQKIDQCSLEELMQLKGTKINKEPLKQTEYFENDFTKDEKVKILNNDDNGIKDSKKLKVPGHKTIFLCPIGECTFSTDKQGMFQGLAAKHVSSDHGIKIQDIKNNPGKFKFKKIKKSL